MLNSLSLISSPSHAKLLSSQSQRNGAGYISYGCNPEVLKYLKEYFNKQGSFVIMSLGPSMTAEALPDKLLVKCLPELASHFETLGEEHTYKSSSITVGLHHNIADLRKGFIEIIRKHIPKDESKYDSAHPFELSADIDTETLENYVRCRSYNSDNRILGSVGYSSNKTLTNQQLAKTLTMAHKILTEIMELPKYSEIPQIQKRMRY